ncbi:MAG: hypothetical protein WCW62_10365 [Bacteroidales bacterium]|jgi:hypothetical protein
MEQLLALAGALIVILLGIVGFWIQKWIKSIDALTEAISDLRVEITTNQVNVDSLMHCTNRCTMIDGQINLHTKSIQENSLNITLLKQSLHYESE